MRGVQECFRVRGEDGRHVIGGGRRRRRHWRRHGRRNGEKGPQQRGAIREDWEDQREALLEFLDLGCARRVRRRFGSIDLLLSGERGAPGSSQGCETQPKGEAQVSSIIPWREQICCFGKNVYIYIVLETRSPGHSHQTQRRHLCAETQAAPASRTGGCTNEPTSSHLHFFTFFSSRIFTSSHLQLSHLQLFIHIGSIIHIASSSITSCQHCQTVVFLSIFCPSLGSPKHRQPPSTTINHYQPPRVIHTRTHTHTHSNTS